MARHTWPVLKIDLRREPWCIVIFMAESILPIIIRGSETAKVDCPERVGVFAGAGSSFEQRSSFRQHFPGLYMLYCEHA